MTNNAVTEKEGSALIDLKAAKEHSDKGEYGHKTQLVRNLLHSYPQDFVVDSPEGQFVGITHVPTGFKMHISRAIVPLELFKQQHGVLKAQNDIEQEKRRAVETQTADIQAQQKEIQKQHKEQVAKAKQQNAINTFATAYEKDASNMLLVAGLHGDEPAGNEAADKLQNVDKITRVNKTGKRRIDGKDPNRHFDKETEGKLQKDILKTIEDKDPDLVVAMHEDDEAQKPYAYASESAADKLKAVLKDKNTAQSAHGDKTDKGVISKGNNPKDGSLEKALDRRGIPRVTIETPSSAQSLEERTATQMDIVNKLQEKSASAQVLQAAGVPVKDPTEILPGGPMQASEDVIAKPKDPNIPMTGPAAIAYRLKNLDLGAIEQQQKDLIKSGKVSKRSNAVKTLNILEGFKRNNLTGADLTVTKVPVIPPVFRPFRMAGSTFVPGDANELYRDLFTMRKLHKEATDEFGEENAGESRLGIYNAVKAVYGFGDPVNPKTASRGVTGFFKKITGANPKYCYDSETEILTRKYGWVFFKDLPEDTEVATLNPTTGAFEWQMPDAYVHAPFEGEMVRLSVGYRVDLLITPNHRMWLRTRVGRMKDSLTEENIVEGWEIEKAWKTANRAGRYWLQTAARGWDGSSVLPECAKGFGDVNLFAEWFGWWMAEGSIHSDGGILHIWQTKANMAYCEELDELMRKLTAAGLSCSKNEHRRDGETIGWVWSIKKCRPLCEWLKASGGISCNTKTIPREILEWAKPQLELFLKSYLKGDGSKRILEIQRNGGATHKFRNPFTDSHGSFVTTSKALFDAITEIGIKIGITIYRRKSYPHLHPADRSETFIGSLVGKWNCVTEGNEAEFVPYSGEVHCCSVPNGLLFVRRNGKTVVSGNSFVQRQLLSKPQDTVSRGTITINPDLTMNQVGVPKDMAWKMYSSYVQRRLVNLGYSPGDAILAIKNQNEDANRALQSEVKERPVIVSRAPAWHKFNAVAAQPVLVEGNTVEINPFITTGMNADFDGDAMNVHVPASDEAVKEAYEKLLPSKMLFTIRDPDKVMPNLKHEQILSLYGAVKRPATKKWKFNSETEALRAIKAGDVSLSDEIEYPGMK